MKQFNVKQVNEKIYVINDEANASFYMVLGNEYAAVIDTGITEGEKIMPVIRKITDKPLKLIITHAHLDHMHHIDEFEDVYMCHEELTLSEDILRKVTGNIDYDLKSTKDIRTGSRIDIGGDILEICQVPGHTPGSVIILEKKYDMLFTGDAIGSGVGVWMQVEGAVSLEEYLDSLIYAQKWLMDRAGRMKFWGGHNYQQYEAIVTKDGYNPLNMGLLADLIDLVEMIIKGQKVGIPCVKNSADKDGENLYASYGRAEILYNVQSIYQS